MVGRCAHGRLAFGRQGFVVLSEGGVSLKNLRGTTQEGPRVDLVDARYHIDVNVLVVMHEVVHRCPTVPTIV